MYATNLSNIYIITFLAILLWTALESKLDKDKRIHSLWKVLNGVGVLISFYIILFYSVLNRTPSTTHSFVFYADIGNEFYREMVMNAFLYFPFGLTLSTLIGPVSILIAFILSVTIESWQYITGSGLAQGTDVLMNTLGTAVGSIPWILVRFGVVEKMVMWGKKIFHRIQDYIEKQRKY